MNVLTYSWKDEEISAENGGKVEEYRNWSNRISNTWNAKECKDQNEVKLA